jgi:hopanoid biosynthesis associated RND transporter like protein HpnN
MTEPGMILERPKQHGQNALVSFLIGVVTFCQARAGAVLIATLILTGAAAYYVANTLSINTDTSQMINRDAAWRQQSAAYDRAFPGSTNLTTIVLDGSSADAVADGSKALAAALKQRPDFFKSVSEPGGGAFFDRYGLMFVSTSEMSDVSDQIAEAQPLLGPLAADTSLRGLFGVLDQALGGMEQGEATGEKLVGPLKTFAIATQSVVDGHPKPVDWGSLMTGRPPRPEQLRHFIEVQPKLDFNAAEPGAAASQVIRDTAQSLHLAEKGVRVRLTGDVPLEDDEIAAVTQGAGTATSLTVLAVILILFLGLRAPRLIVAIMLTIAVGLVATAAFAAVAVGTLNRLSVAFAVLFIGIGVDFGIQFSMRYRAELHALSLSGAAFDRARDNPEALRRTAAFVAAPLSIAALAIAVGFFSFLPTNYRGVSELGLISGTSMFIALLSTLTVLPALLSMFPGRGKAEAAGFAWAAPIDHWLARHARAVTAIAIVIAVGAAATIPFVRFDADPLKLKDPSRESTKTALELTNDKSASPYSIEVLMPSLAAAEPMVDKLAAMPEASMVLWLGSFVPSDQAAKLEILSQIQLFLGPILDQTAPQPMPSDAEEHQAVASFTAHLTQFLTGPHGKELKEAGPALLKALQAFAAMPHGGDVAELRQVLLGGLPGRLDGLRQTVQATKLTLETMPADIRDEWLSKTGQARIEVFAKGDMKDERQLANFVHATRRIAPNAVGGPVAIYEAGRTVSDAFVGASLTALVAITIVLAVILRRPRDVILVIVPLVLAGLYSLGMCVMTGLAFNYANVIAVPLLMGIGVAFDIYFVMAWRHTAGPPALLQTPTARAIIFSAGTTGTAFGSLALSRHAGTASMGLLLVLSLMFVVICTLFVQPALMTLLSGSARKR